MNLVKKGEFRQYSKYKCLRQIERWKHDAPVVSDIINLVAGNMLEVKNDNNEKILVMSQEARLSLNIEQTNLLENDCKIVSPDIHNIENTGGGSARCMIAELF